MCAIYTLPQNSARCKWYWSQSQLTLGREAGYTPGQVASPSPALLLTSQNVCREKERERNLPCQNDGQKRSRNNKSGGHDIKLQDHLIFWGSSCVSDIENFLIKKVRKEMIWENTLGTSSSLHLAMLLLYVQCERGNLDGQTYC